jgi:predicted nucleotidyltransferase component of viral defense system
MMLSLDEIQQLAGANGLKPDQEEKRYIQSIALGGIYKTLGNRLVFKGGTDLFLLQGLDRFSEDLDFTAREEVEAAPIIDAIAREMERAGVEASVRRKDSVAGITISILAKGPRYSSPPSICPVRVDISQRGDLLLPPQARLYVSRYKDVPSFMIPSIDPSEAAAEKVRAVLKRNYARDAYDLHFLLASGHRPTAEMVSKKMGYYREEYVRREFEAALRRKAGLWERELKLLLPHEVPEFDAIEKELLEMMRKIGL